MVRKTVSLWGTAWAAMSGRHRAASTTMDPAAEANWGSLTVLVLATFVGLGVIGRVSRLLHTPLMSLTNAISAISVVGSILITGSDFPPRSACSAPSRCLRR